MNAFTRQFANILTTFNLLFGLASMHAAYREQYELSVIFLVLASISDMFDGHVARKLNIASEIGKYLDSNADLVSFGVAPAWLIYLQVMQDFEILGPIFAAGYVLCASLRLAKFNMVKFKGYYVGLPTTLAGPIMALSSLLVGSIPAYSFLIITAVTGLLMISTFKVKKLW